MFKSAKENHLFKFNMHVTKPNFNQYRPGSVLTYSLNEPDVLSGVCHHEKATAQRNRLQGLGTRVRNNQAQNYSPGTVLCSGTANATGATQY